jgi:hypothetical protein
LSVGQGACIDGALSKELTSLTGQPRRSVEERQGGRSLIDKWQLALAGCAVILVIVAAKLTILEAAQFSWAAFSHFGCERPISHGHITPFRLSGGWTLFSRAFACPRELSLNGLRR